MKKNLLESPRALLTALHKAAVEGANPFVRTHDAVRDWIAANAIQSSQRVHLFALGKAGATMASGAVAALGEHGISVTGGVVVVAAIPERSARAEQGGQLPASLEIHAGDHPVPDIGSLAAADIIARKVNDVRPGDVALVLISGGATSLCAAPCDELTAMLGHAMKGQQLLTGLVQSLHERGLAIHEMNAIRRRLLRWGGGRLAVALENRGAREIRVFAVSDVIGDQPSVIGSGPCSPDPMSEEEFLAMLDAYNMRDIVSGELAVALGLQGDGSAAVLPPHRGEAAFDLVQFDIVARNRDACAAIAAKAREIGLENITVVDTPITGEAETVGHTIASIALRAAAQNEGPQLLVWGGEPTVSFAMENRVHGHLDSEGPLPDTLGVHRDGQAPYLPMSALDKHHKQGPNGGRMQALALAGSLALQRAGRESYRIFLLAAGTDGRDGPTDACGAIVDALTPFRAEVKGRDPIRDLHRLRSYNALKAAGSLLKTGPTGTNVMDVVVAYIEPARTEPTEVFIGAAPPLR